MANRFALGGVVLLGSIVYANAASKRINTLGKKTLKQVKTYLASRPLDTHLLVLLGTI